MTTDKPDQASIKKQMRAGMFGIFTGAWGIHKFILGYRTEGIIMLVIGIFTLGTVTSIIGLIEGIIYLTKSNDEFVNTYVVNKKGWF